MLGVSFDPPVANKAFKDKFDFPYDLLSDTDHAMSKAFGAAADDSRVASRVSVLVGPDGTVARSYGKVSPADHPSEVIGDLDGLK